MRNSFTALLLTAMAATYCSGNEARGDGGLQQPLAPVASQPISISRLASGADPLTYYSDITEPTRTVVRDAAAWAETWARIWRERPAPPLPAVDFSREMLIVAALGTRPSGGYSIAVESASRDGGSLVVQIRTVSPGSNCMASLALTSPVDVARLPRSDDNVQFRENAVQREC